MGKMYEGLVNPIKCINMPCKNAIKAKQKYLVKQH
jgi:hypothetical protein